MYVRTHTQQEAGVNGTGRVDLITCLPSSTPGGRAVQAEAHRGRADGQMGRRPTGRASLMAINYKPGTPQRGATGLGWARGIVTTCRIAGTWNTWGVEEVGELRPDAMVGPGSTTGSQGFQLQRFEAHPGVRGRCEARRTVPDWPDWPRLCPGWGVDLAAPASVVGVQVRT